MGGNSIPLLLNHNYETLGMENREGAAFVELRSFHQGKARRNMTQAAGAGGSSGTPEPWNAAWQRWERGATQAKPTPKLQHHFPSFPTYPMKNGGSPSEPQTEPQQLRTCCTTSFLKAGF